MKTKLLLIVAIFLAVSTNAQVYLYGTTSKGGANDKGVIYRTDAFGQNYQIVHHFDSLGGHTPIWGMTLAPNGKLYGFTSEGGALVNAGATFKLGTLYEFDPVTSTYNVKKYIDDQTNFGTNFTQFIVNNNGELVTASIDGPLDTSSTTFEESRIFKFEPSSNQITILDTIPSIHAGIFSPIIQGLNGDYYFTSKTGGNTFNGSIGSYNGNQFATVYSLTGQTDGGAGLPVNNPVFQDTDGKLYLITAQGGHTNSGAGLRINTDGSGYEFLIGFSTNTPSLGIKPSGALKKHNNHIYFLNSELGDFNNGTIYRIDLGNISSNNIVKALDTEGAKPEAGFTESTNGKWYFVCNEGGDYNNGSIVEFDPSTEITIKRHSFSSSSGYNPRRAALVVVDFNSLSISNTPENLSGIELYPNPSSKLIQIKTNDFVKIKSLEIINELGQLVGKNIELNGNLLDVSTLTDGIYFIRLIMENNQIISKRIIKN